MDIAGTPRIHLATRMEYVKKIFTPAKTRTFQDIRMNRDGYFKHGAYLRFRDIGENEATKIPARFDIWRNFAHTEDREDSDIKSYSFLVWVDNAGR